MFQEWWESKKIGVASNTVVGIISTESQFVVRTSLCQIICQEWEGLVPMSSFGLVALILMAILLYVTQTLVSLVSPEPSEASPQHTHVP